MFRFDDLDEKRRRKIKQFVDLCRRHVSEYSVISADPTVLFMPVGLDLAHFVRDYGLLFESLGERQVYIICSTYWYFERKENIDELVKLLNRFRDEHPNLSFIFLCNTPRQLELFADNNIESVFCSNNCFVDERLFFPMPDAEKSIDAVYDGRLADWKRHELAASIDSLGLIYYALPWHEDNSYMRGLVQRFDGGRFFNHDASGAYRRLTPGEVNAALNTCRVGLCLSAEEGAMYASVQYLLAGLPVVTTPSVGGRDIFFDDEIAITAEPTPQAIGDAVRKMIGRGLEPEYIRGKTLERLNVHRGYFVDLVQAIYDKHGVARNFSGEWPSIFHNKMLRNLNHSETARQLGLGGRA